jgi:serine/threonine protein kinase/DNA-binding beta-propeller fold protein YncE
MFAASTAQFAGYRVEAVAGRGGMGVVYKATQLGLDRPVALKVIAEGLLGDQRIRERFLRESRAAAAIEHPNVIPIHASGEYRGRAYIAMRFVDGDDLRERVAASGPLAPEQAAAIVAHVGAALDAAHEAGLVHRDVKPANILLGAHGQVYLSDFGLARHALSDAGPTEPGGWVGTMDFMAPEQIRGQPVDGRADIYALGCVLHFALTGQVPYPRETNEARLWSHLHAAPPEPSRLTPGVPEEFDEVVRRALEKQPEERQPSAGELGAAALAAAAGVTTVVRPKRAAARHRRRQTARSATWPDAPRPTRRRHGRAVAAALAAAAAGAVAAVLFANGHTDHSPTTSTAPPPPPPTTTTTAAATGKPPGGKEHVIALPHVVRSIRVGTRPVNVEVADGSAWVASTGTPWLDRVALDGTRRRHGPRLGFGVTDITDRRGELWVTVAVARQVVRVRASTGHQIGSPIAMMGEPRAIDAGEGAVWVAEQSPAGPDNLVEIDPHTATVVGRVPIAEGINDIRAANGAVWVLGRRAPVLIKVSGATRQPLVRIKVGRHAERVDVAAGYVWVTDYGDDEVTRVDPKGPKFVKIDVPGKPYGLHARDDGVWVACYGDQSVVRIDPRAGRVVGKPIRVRFNPVGVDVSGHSVWVTSVSDNRLTRIDLR